MRLSEHYNFIFFANPKTGSDSVRTMLDPYSIIKSVRYRETTKEMPFYSHIRPCEVRDIMSEWNWDFYKYFRFTFIRNPWDRLVSLYEWTYNVQRDTFLRKCATLAKPVLKGKIGNAVPRARRIWKKIPSFNEWVNSIQADGPGGGGRDDQRWLTYGTYSIAPFAQDNKGNWLVDKVIRLEDIESELLPTLDGLGLPVDEMSIPRTNVTRRKEYRKYYDDCTRKRVERMYEYDIDVFKYAF